MKNKRLHLIISILYPFWLLISFYLIYLFMTNGANARWAFSSHTFKVYLFFIQPISIIWIGYILVNGHIRNIKKKIREILIISSILLVFAFTMIQWTSVTTLYGQYGTSIKNDKNTLFLLPETTTSYEYETLFREAVKIRYDIMFKKIWTFGFFIFFSTFLLLCIIKKDEKISKNIF